MNVWEVLVVTQIRRYHKHYHMYFDVFLVKIVFNPLLNIRILSANYFQVQQCFSGGGGEGKKFVMWDFRNLWGLETA